jgi:predicted RNA-binding Zn-ribbon protein involved in translation (DUF1610 family)
MAETIKCPGCEAVLRVRADMAGKQIQCPRCGRAVTVPAPGAITEKAKPAATEAVTVEPLEDDEEEEVRVKRPGAKGAAELPEDEEEVQVKRRSRYQPCPRCGAEESKRIPFTFWGSFYFTALFAHVGCPACGYRYNGRTGRSNLLPAIVCVSVAVLCLLGLLGVIYYILHGRGYV